MGTIADIFSKLLAHNPQPEAQASAPAATPAAPAPANTGAPAPATSGTPAPAASAAPAQTVDVAAILDGLAAKSSQKLNWKQSIVDMMGLLGMDNSLTARKHLATELGYTGDQSDSATMNIWLHKEVMKKLAENGGKVPANLLD